MEDLLQVDKKNISAELHHKTLMKINELQDQVYELQMLNNLKDHIIQKRLIVDN